MPRTIKSADTVPNNPRMAKKDQFPFANDGTAFNMKHFTTSEEKALSEVTKAWFDKQPITGIGGARRFQHNQIRYETFKRLCSSIVEGGWTVSQPIRRPTLFPSTFSNKALLVGTLKEDTNDYRHKGVHLKKGTSVWAVPKVTDRRDNVKLVFKTEEGIPVEDNMVKLMPRYDQRAELWNHLLSHHDERENYRVTEYNLKLAVAIFRERLRESVSENRELTDIELCHKVPAAGFQTARLATPIFDGRVLNNTLNRRAPSTLEDEFRSVLLFDPAWQGNLGGLGHP